MKLRVSLVLFLYLFIGSVRSTENPIKHVVVLMLENRAFDHMLGYMKTLNPEIEGLNGDETNPDDPDNPNSPLVKVNDQAPYVDPNPDHSIPGSTLQIFGNPNKTYLDPPPMNGFVKSANGMHQGWGPKIMSCFNPTTVPVITTLASEFALFDHWFASVPGPTEVNRMYIHSATSHGAGSNDVDELVRGYPQKTIYDTLYENNISWNIYFEEATTTWFLDNMRKPEYFPYFKPFYDFEYDVINGNLATYTFIEPRYFSVPYFPANDQHPSHDVSQGELLMKQVYEVLRNSPMWNDTLLIITYDEHGGFYDHFPTPVTHVPNPDGINSTSPPFDFQRLGIRVPAILISPWVNKGVVIHEPEGPTEYSHYDHTSLLATLKKMWNLPSFLTKRDEWAGTFEGYLQQRSEPRTDCPSILPYPPKFYKHSITESQQPINDLQKSILAMCSDLNGGTDDWKHIKTEEEGALFCRKETSIFLNRVGTA